MAAPNCKNPNEFVNRIASVKSHLMENGVIDKYYNITDYNKYREFVVKDRQLLRDKYSIEAAPYYANKTPRGWTLQINDELMYRLDAINGKFYAENSHFRNNIDPLLSSSHTYLKATAQSLERFKDDPKSKKLSELFDQLSVKFQNAFNIASYKIDSSRATEILKNTNTPYKGQAAFAYGGNIYFVEDVANITSVLHEYAHPLIKVIAKDNNKLFNKLYKDVVNTATGVYIRKRVLEKYPELDVESDRFKEEVLVTALETKATNVLGNEIDKKGLDGVIKRILYAIKQILRKLTSAKNFKTFDENTTLDQLANMMVSEDFVIDTSRIDMESIVDFQKQFSDLYNKLQNVESGALVQAVNRAYVEGKFQLKTLRDKPYKFKEKLNEMGGLKALRNMRDYVKDYQTIEKSESEVEDILKMLDEQQDDFRVRSVALVNSINQAKELGMDIAEILYDLEKNNRHKTAEGITRITFFKEFLIGQKQFIRELEKILKLPPGNEFLEELLTVRSIAENSLDKIKDLQMEFVLDLMQENTSFMQENLEKKITRDIERLLSKSNVPDEKVKSIVEQVIGTENPQGFKVSNVTINGEALKLDSYVAKELQNKITRYFAKRFTQDSIRKYVSGETEDLGFISSMALPYMSMDDPIGSFVAYTKKEMNKAQAKSLDKANEISNKLVPLLEAVGYNKLDTQQLMKMIGFEDTIGVYNNETGEVDQIKIYTYLNKFKDYRYDKEVLERNVEKAFESGNKDKIMNARRELREFEENYMHRKYKKEYYDAGKMWSEDNVVTHPITKETFTVSSQLSQEAYVEKQTVSRKLATLSISAFTELEESQETTQLDAYRQDYDQLHNLYNEEGDLKTGDELKKTLVRIKYRENTKNFYEWVVDEDKAQKDFSQYIQNLAADGITRESKPEEFAAKIKEFERRNYRIAYTPEYFAEYRDIMDSLRELGTDPDLLKLFEQRSRIVRRLTDKNGHSRGTEYSLEQQKLLLEVEESIQDYFSTQNAKLTDDQLLRYDNLRAKSQNEGLTDDEKIEYATLLTKKTGSEEGDTTAKTRSELLSRLTDLREYRVTDYYIDAMNAALSEVDVKAPTMLTYEEWLTSSSLKTAMQNERFAKWFKSNHYQKYKFVKGKKVLTYYPTSLWTYKAPKNPDYFKVTKLVDPISGKEITINGVPTGRRYGYNKIKNEYRTIPVGADRSKYVGTIIDNKGNYLPREYNPNAANSAIDGKYMNEKYAQMKASNSSEFQLLEALKEIHLDIQKNRPLSSKLYLDMPRFSKIIRSNLEIIQSGGVQEKLQTIYENAVSIFKKRGDDVEKFDYGVNFDVDALLIQTDLQGDPISRIPVRGLYNIPIKETSVDILRGLYEYMYSLNEQEVLIKNEPIAQAMSNVFSDPENAIKDQARASKGIFSNTGKLALLKKSDNRRTQALNYFIEKTWYGKAYSNFEQENPMTTKIANMLMHAASRSFIALDTVSALKNRFGMVLQNNIESAAGKYYNPVSFAKGRFMSAQAMTELSSRGIYSVAPKSRLVQILEYFDPITGKTKNDFGKSTSRTFIKDMLDGTFLYDGRRFLDVEGGLQVLFGMLKHQKIKQTLPNGEVKEITYDEAFELNENNKLVLKEGIDPEWGFEETTHDYVESDTLESIAKKYNTTVDLIKEYNKLESLDQVSPGDTLIISKASKFLDFQLRMQGVGKRLNGMPDRFDSPQGEKFLGYRLFMFYKKYATGMFLNRFQADNNKNNRWGDVYNWELGEPTRGYYISGISAMLKAVTSLGKSIPLMSPEERQALQKMVTEVLFLAALGFAAGMLFAYDPDDPDRFQKLREKQEDSTWGWLSNHMLYQLIMVERENSAFIPIPPLGLDDWIKFGDVTSIVTGPTIKLYSKILMDILYMASGDERAMYKQDAGPYDWQKKEKYKLWNHLFSLFGIKGKNYDPVYAIKTAEIFENLK